MRGCLGRVASLRSLLSTSQRNAVHKPPSSVAAEGDLINRVDAAPTTADGSELHVWRESEGGPHGATEKETNYNNSGGGGGSKTKMDGAKLKRTLSQRSNRSLGRKKYLARGRSNVPSVAPSTRNHPVPPLPPSSQKCRSPFSFFVFHFFPIRNSFSL